MARCAAGFGKQHIIHTKFAKEPILDDGWAIDLHTPRNRERVRQAPDVRSVQVTPGFDASPAFALGVGSLRYAEDEVECCVEGGIDQYLILGAGFDTFALNRPGAAGSPRPSWR